MKSWEYDYFKTLVYKTAGILLDTNKEEVVEGKIQRFLRQEDIRTIGDLIRILRKGTDHKLVMRLVDQMTINETLFFRDPYFYDALREDVFPALIEKRKKQRSLTIWSAASSSGQEIYSVAMLIMEHFRDITKWRLDIVATDISETMLARCREGRYSGVEVGRGLPPEMKRNYFEPADGGWRVRKSVRDLVEFRSLNLAGPWGSLPTVDLLLMRNVLIYFDDRTKDQIFRRAHKLMRQDGFMALGGGEQAVGVDDVFERVTHGRAVFYRPKANRRPIKATG